MKNQSYNTLIAGVIGSGKSFTEKKIIDNLLKMPEPAYMVLIDPKRVELAQYRDSRRCLWYGCEEEDIHDILLRVYDLMDLRFQRMQAAGQTNTTEPHVFCIVDEMAFLMQSKRKKEYVQMFSRICLLGRAAKIHLILCSQVSTQDVIPACIRDNMTNLVVLRQRDAQKYRYLLGCFPGALPMIGNAYVYTPSMDEPEKIDSADVWSVISKD